MNQSKKDGLVKRDAEIVSRRLAGEYLGDLAAAYGLSLCRAKEIMRKAGINRETVTRLGLRKKPNGPCTIPILERIEANIEYDTNGGCWLWGGTLDAYGYGLINYQNTKHRAHRLTYSLLRRPFPKELDVDHLCRVPACVNPDHLEPVTHAENVRRGLAGVPLKDRALVFRSKPSRSSAPVTYRGTNVPLLTTEQKAELRQLHASGTMNGAELGRLFGVSTSIAWNIIKMRTLDWAA